MNMDIILIALVAVIVTIGIFVILDRKKKNEKTIDEIEKQSPTTIKTKPVAEGKLAAVDYGVYIMSAGEKIFYILVSGAVFFLIGFIFYQNLIVSGVLALLGFYYPKLRTKQLVEKRKQELSIQFKHALYSLASALAVGKSVENAFRDIVEDLKMLFGHTDVHIIREIELINRKVENGETIENAIADFSARAKLEDIQSFSDVFITCKRTGGDLIEVIRKTANIIGEKLEIKQEISVLIAQKKFESQILTVAPLAFVALLSFSSQEYMEPLYQLRTGGVFVMTGALIGVAFAYWLSTKIMNIKV
ncbi:type II secretion system F family protein [Caldalkalibacillus mannanilyticus]|uniref:type II secretion system F family protein n=1 Tax=Caldalkalibacillus mannanilyticus TaxID=1418 RepID=UPI0009DCF4A1|nr:type II secretion system F family protein [Caldalkalibacillus mannanilyticus]